MDFNRDNFLEVDLDVEDIDLLSNNLFRDYWTNTGLRFTVTAREVGRPDLVAERMLGSQDLWWAVMKYNHIDDPWNELYPGLVLKVPSLADLQSYAVDRRVR